jgi:hypothetical protein
MEFACSGLPGHEGRRGFYMHVYSGGVYFPCDPRLDEVNIEDIAHHLAMQCRFAGATMRFVSVAEHSILCSLIDGPAVSAQDQLEALMHDAAEAYIQDFIRPIKYLPELKPIYAVLEDLNERVIAEKFGLRLPWSRHVRMVDETVCNLEMRDNIRRADKGRLHDVVEIPEHLRLQFWSPPEAENFFLSRFHQLRRRVSADASIGKVSA